MFCVNFQALGKTSVCLYLTRYGAACVNYIFNLSCTKLSVIEGKTSTDQNQVSSSRCCEASAMICKTCIFAPTDTPSSLQAAHVMQFRA